MPDNNHSFEIRVVYDDICSEKDYIGDFGFSVLIHNILTNQYILFDAGTNGEILLHNLKVAGVSPSKIDIVIISHDHFDHTGGLKELSKKSQFELVVPHDVKRSFQNEFPKIEVRGVIDPIELEENVFTSGQLGDHIKEQALFLTTSANKQILIVGCTHPGLDKFIVEAQKTSEIRAVIGGFHGFRKFSYFNDIEFVGACHCTQFRQEIKTKYPDKFIEPCVGSFFKF